MEVTPAAPQRFFIALLPPEPIRTCITEIQQYFCDRYHSKAALRSPPHITLQPPFEWPPATLPGLSAGLAAFAQKWAPIPITLRGFAAFPPRVIYIDVAPAPALMTLKPALATFMTEQFEIIDAKAKHRAFKPHLTVAFRDLKPGAFRKAWPEFEHQPLEFEFTAAALTLLQHNGRRWNTLEQYAFQSQPETAPPPEPTAPPAESPLPSAATQATSET